MVKTGSLSLNFENSEIYFHIETMVNLTQCLALEH